MATSIIKGVKTGTLTAQNGFTLSETEVKQIGNVCYVKFYATKSAGTGTSEVQIATLSGIDMPKTVTRKICGAGENAYSTYFPAYSVMGTTGGISVTSQTSRKTVVIDFTYIV